MDIEKIKEELNPDDIESLVHWEQYMYSYFPREMGDFHSAHSSNV